MCTRIWAALGASVLAGCFYVDPINERPSADIERIEPELPARGETVEVYAQIYDDGDADPHATWYAYACNDDRCDVDPHTTGADYRFLFVTPTHMDDGSPTTRVRIELEVTDDLGAIAVPRQTLDVNLDNAQPALGVLQQQGRVWRTFYPVSTPVLVFATATDADDGVDGITIADPVVSIPEGTSATLEDITVTRVDDAEVADGTATWRVLATEPGPWGLRVVVTDAVGETDESTATVAYAADHAPCLAAADPGFPPEGSAIVVDTPRRFAVVAVDDDRDVFPPPPVGDEVLGAATFAWQLASPATGGERVALATDGNSVEIDPADYTPGDQLELRVDVLDRDVTRQPCDDALATCTVDTACDQRRTWFLEIR